MYITIYENVFYIVDCKTINFYLPIIIILKSKISYYIDNFTSVPMSYLDVNFYDN